MNIENYNLVLAEIREHPENWDQRNWCGTACCFAGHAQLLAGKAPDRETVQSDAMEFLGIDNLYAEYLFSGARTLDDFGAFAAMTEAEQLERAVEAAPWEALQFAQDRMSAEQVERAAKAAPWEALQFALDRMTPEQLAWCNSHNICA